MIQRENRWKTLTVDNTLTGTYNSYIGKTDKEGNYTIAVGKVRTYQTSAYIVKNYSGVDYLLPLHPDNDEVFSNEAPYETFSGNFLALCQIRGIMVPISNLTAN